MTTPLELSENLAGAVEAAGPSLVRVEGRRRLPSTGIAWSEDLVVTAHHTVERDEGLGVVLPDGREVEATLAGRDPGTDLALLKVPGAKLTRAGFAELDGLKVGHLVLALGRPGRTVRAALGIVGAFGERWRTPAGGRVDRYLEAGLELPPGFSGGALVDARGRVLGLMTSGLLRGHALAVPAATVRRVVEALAASGSVRRGFLGVGSYPVRLPAALAAKAAQESAVLVVAVEPGSPAEQGGLLLGDAIVAFDGAAVERVGDLLELLDEERIGKTVSVRLVRAGELRELPFTVGARP